MEEFPEVICKRCEKRTGPQYTVPLRLVTAGETAWQSLCGDCFRAVLQVEPWDDLTMHPVKHSRRSRRQWG